MAALIVAFLFSLAFYLALTAGSGGILLWSYGEILFGTLFAFLTALLTRKIFSAFRLEPSYGFLNPKRWVIFLAYAMGPFFYHMARANLDVAYRVITGRIRPGIVRISPGLKTDLGVAMLANSITLTPGTLSVDVGKNREMYVHWIHVENKDPEPREVCYSFPEWIRRIVE